jgi:hypothetical protein
MTTWSPFCMFSLGWPFVTCATTSRIRREQSLSATTSSIYTAGTAEQEAVAYSRCICNIRSSTRMEPSPWSTTCLSPLLSPTRPASSETNTNSSRVTTSTLRRTLFPVLEVTCWRYSMRRFRRRIQNGRPSHPLTGSTRQAGQFSGTGPLAELKYSLAAARTVPENRSGRKIRRGVPVVRTRVSLPAR